MKTIKTRLQQLLFKRQLWITLLIILGSAITIIYSIRSYQSYTRFQYIQAAGLDRGAASIEAIQGWMPIRYVSVAYSVPEEYVFAQLNIPFNRRNSDDTLYSLNRVYHLGQSEKGDYPAIIDMVGEAILAYRENPVATGLEDIRGWMTIQYIANSTGVPEDYLLEQLDLSAEDNNLYRPLGELADVNHYRGGGRALEDKIKRALQEYEVKQ